MACRRDVTYDTFTEREKMWYLLKHGSLPKLSVYKHARTGVPTGEPPHLEYIISDKQYKDINWEKQ